MKLIPLIISLGILGLFGCSSDKPDTSALLQNPYPQLSSNTEKIETATIIIDKSTDKAISLNKDKAIAVILPVIKSTNSTIKELNENTKEQLVESDKIIKSLEDDNKQIDKLKTELKEAKGAMGIAFKWINTIAYGLCLLGIAAGFVMIYLKMTSSGIGVIALSTIMLGVVIFVSLYQVYVAIGAGLLLLAAVIYVGIRYHEGKSIISQLKKKYENTNI